MAGFRVEAVLLVMAVQLYVPPNAGFHAVLAPPDVVS